MKLAARYGFEKFYEYFIAVIIIIILLIKLIYVYISVQQVNSPIQ